MKIVTLSLLLISFCSFSQEELLVKYKFGRPGIPDSSINQLQKLVKQFDKTGIDSIHFVGSSDSAGLFLSNFRMTEWRARILRNFCADQIKSDVNYKILPTENKGQGEVRDVNAVSIHVFPSPILDKKKPKPSELPNSSCYQVAYHALQSYLVTFQRKGSRGYVFLERYFPLSKNDDEVYYTGSVDEKGNFIPVPLKWKMTRTGKQHWKGERYIAKIKQDAFDKYKIFTIENEPCSECHDDFKNNLMIEDDQPINKPDYVLMEELQYRQPWLTNNKIKVRIPKEYVDKELAYVSNRDAIEWEENENSPDYYFARVSQSDGNVNLIYRPYRVPVDEKCTSEKEFNFSNPMLRCSPSKARSEVINYVEVGMHNQNSTNFPYAAIGVFAGTSVVELEFLAGIHQKGAFYGAIRGRYNILNVPFNALSFGNSWKHSMPKNRFWYSKLYVGAEYKASLGRRSTNYLEPNVNVGLSFAQNGNPTFQRFFVQYGKGVNFILESPHVSYSILQFGVQIHLGKKEYLKEEGVL